eukprot:gene18334-biopygen18921
MVTVVVSWTERHIAAGADPDAFLRRATSVPSQIFGASPLLAAQPMHLSTLVDGGAAITFAVPSYPPPPSACFSVAPCFPGVPCQDDLQAPRGFTCEACPPGFEGDGETCTDVDECSTSSANGTATFSLRLCDLLTTCTNLPGGFECSLCPHGYWEAPGSWEGGDATSCMDVDDCVEPTLDSCGLRTLCINAQGSVVCGACPAGYEGSSKGGCVDIDECADQILRGGCAPQAECINLDGSSSCGPCQASDQGEEFKGDGHECRLASGSCADANGGCDKLTLCEEANDGGAVQCGDCPDGTTGTGETACKEINGCASSPCFDHTMCSDIPAPGVGAACESCPEGYLGDGRTCLLDKCTADARQCSVTPPVPCTNLHDGDVLCARCPPGYTGDGTTCTDVDECMVNNGGCHHLSLCANEPGSFSCGPCPAGYIGSGYTRCREMTRACNLQHGGCDPLVTCADSEGGVVCGECPDGYIGDGLSGCKDIDGCAGGDSMDTCYPGVQCEDIPAPGQDGSGGKNYRCAACPAGLTGDGKTCTTNTCFYFNGGCDAAVSCIFDADHPAGRVCGKCPPGYTDEFTGGDGSKCEDVDGCRASPCSPLRACTDVRAPDQIAVGATYQCGPCPGGYLQ